jgi:hypothetical protein
LHLKTRSTGPRGPLAIGRIAACRHALPPNSERSPETLAQFEVDFEYVDHLVNWRQCEGASGRKREIRAQNGSIDSGIGCGLDSAASFLHFEVQPGLHQENTCLFEVLFSGTYYARLSLAAFSDLWPNGYRWRALVRSDGAVRGEATRF